MPREHLCVLLFGRWGLCSLRSLCNQSTQNCLLFYSQQAPAPPNLPHPQTRAITLAPNSLLNLCTKCKRRCAKMYKRCANVLLPFSINCNAVKNVRTRTVTEKCTVTYVISRFLHFYTPTTATVGGTQHNNNNNQTKR